MILYLAPFTLTPFNIILCKLPSEASELIKFTRLCFNFSINTEKKKSNCIMKTKEHISSAYRYTLTQLTT